MGLFDAFARLRDGLARTRDGIVEKIRTIVRGTGKIDEALLERLEEILLAGDVGASTTALMIGNIRRRVKREGIEDAAALEGMLRDEVERLLSDAGAKGAPAAAPPLPAAGETDERPHVVMIVGVNGAGKTTTVGKLAHNERMAGRRTVIAAADTFRAAANEQLEVWAQRAGVEVIGQAHGADPASVAFDALRAATARGADSLIIDTAGRLHTKVNLMEELRKIRRVLAKLLPGAPHEVLLVLDGSTGQNAIEQARHFTAAVGVTGLIVTKLDGTAKGGVVIAIGHELGIPVRYIGVGERIGDLQPFDRGAFVRALFGTGETA